MQGDPLRKGGMLVSCQRHAAPVRRGQGREAAGADGVAVQETRQDLWVFGYGSLIWRPGFTFVESAPGRLFGYRRALCIYSHVHRGTPDRPGLVLGLDRGGICRGVAYRVAPALAQETMAYLREREQATAVYLERQVTIRLDDGRRIVATTYVADRTHPQYAGRLSDEAKLALVQGGRGISGPNPDYVLQTHSHLRDLGVRDRELADLAAALAAG
jgi:cation transport protein ChaC